MTPADKRAIVFSDVVKRYGDVAALNRASFSVATGETVALLGPNGAGKTTCVDLLLNLRHPTSGEVRVLGRTPASAVASGQVATMLQSGGLPPGARVRELVTLVRRIYGNARTFDEIVEMANISQIIDRRVEKLSGGQQQRTRLAMTLAGRPGILFLDEPTVALDTEARGHFWTVIRQIASEGTTILFATHYLEEADANATRIIVLNRGRVIADDTPSNLKAETGRRSVRFDMNGHVPASLENLPGVHSVSVEGRQIVIRTDDTDAVLAALYASRVPVHNLDVAGPGLDDVLRDLTMTVDH